jgi:hypothetical protein
MSKHIVVIVKEPKRRAEGCRDSSGDRRQFRPRKFQFEEPGCFIHSRPAARGKDPACGEAAAWDDLHERFAIKRIEHQEAYGLDGARTDMAEEYFSRRRCAEIGIHQHIAGSHLPWYAGESSWREDECRVSDRDQVNQIAEALNAAHAPRHAEGRASG